MFSLQEFFKTSLSKPAMDLCCLKAYQNCFYGACLMPEFEHRVSEVSAWCVKVSSLQHPSGTAVTNVAWFHVGIGEQSAASRCSSGFLALKTRAVQPHGVQGGTYGSCGFRSHQGNKSVYCR